jgi:hypothetical protein
MFTFNFFVCFNITRGFYPLGKVLELQCYKTRLGKIFGLEGEEVTGSLQLHNKSRDLYSSPNNNRVLKSTAVRWMCQIASTEEVKKRVIIMWIGYLKGRDQFRYINPLNAELNPICHLLVLLGNLTFMGPCIVSIFQYTYIFNKKQRYTVYLYLETALHVSGGTSTHHQERIQLYLQHLI